MPLVCLLVLSAALSPTRAQSAPDESGTRHQASPWRAYAELFGHGGAGSLNLERDTRFGPAVRVGAGYATGLGTSRPGVTAPVLLVLTPPGGRGLEISAGAVLKYATGRNGGVQRPRGTASVGYRWRTAEGDLFRAGLAAVVFDGFVSGVVPVPFVGTGVSL